MEGSWLKHCIVEYQNLVSPFLVIPRHRTTGRHAWEIRREATLFFHDLDATKMLRISLDDLHKNATTKLERAFSRWLQYPLTRAAYNYRNLGTSFKEGRSHSFKCLQHDCAIHARNCRWLYISPPRRMRPGRFYDTVAEDTSPPPSDSSDDQES